MDHPCQTPVSKLETQEKQKKCCFSFFVAMKMFSQGLKSHAFEALGRAVTLKTRTVSRVSLS
jgi:hypothetical protein